MNISFKTHFCLVSSQAAANLLPILDSKFKPEKAVFLVSKDMHEKAKYLRSVFEKEGVDVSSVGLENVFDFQAVKAQLEEILDNYKKEDIALNATGGTKLMAIAAYDVFKSLAKPIFYLDTNNNKITFLSKDSKQDAHDLNIIFKAEQYLNSYGYSIMENTGNRTNIDSINAKIAYLLLNYYSENKEVIELLNKYSSKNAKKNLNRKEQKNSPFQELLIKLRDYDFIDYDQSSFKINIRNEKNRRFLNGGWLEELVFDIVKKMDETQNALLNAEILYPSYNKSKPCKNEENQGKNNELDIVFMAKNKMHIIECKTQKKRNLKQEILYKLESVAKSGGIMSKLLLISLYPVSHSIKNRAENEKIKIIEVSDFSSLKRELKDWIG